MGVDASNVGVECLRPLFGGYTPSESRRVRPPYEGTKLSVGVFVYFVNMVMLQGTSAILLMTVDGIT